MSSFKPYCFWGSFPNTFTPNNDGINDAFKPLISGRINDYEFTVYNIYGQIVFSSRRPGEGWNGMYRNLLQNAGTYVWICRYKATNEAPRLTKGSVLPDAVVRRLQGSSYRLQGEVFHIHLRSDAPLSRTDRHIFIFPHSHISSTPARIQSVVPDHIPGINCL